MSAKQVVLLATLLSIACGPPPQIVPLVIDDATVIDPLSGRAAPNHSVFIEEGRIVGVEASGRTGAFAATDTINGTGRFLIPGLIDMHVHLFRDEAVAGPTLDLLLANGITGFREMASDCLDPVPEGALCPEALRQLALQVQGQERVAPEPLALASAPVNGVAQRGRLPAGAPPFLAPGTESEGRALARWLADRPIDVVKVYNSVPRGAYFSLMDEAAQLGLEISGHLPLGVSVVEASNAGQRTIEHARDLPTECSDYSHRYRKIMSDVVDGIEGAEAPGNEERLRAILSAFDAATCESVFGTLVANGTYLVPTHGTREMDFRASDPAYRDDGRMKYMLSPIRQGWEADLDRTAQASPELVALFGDFYELGVQLSGAAHTAGVKVMAGTDANDTMMFPGFALHDELARFADAGISPMEVLRTATTIPAEYLRRIGDLGTISVGGLADLVLLSEDPLSNIRNTTRIEAVVLRGRVLNRAALDEMLRAVETAVEGTDEN